MDRKPITILFCTILLAVAPVAFSAQSCAVDVPEASIGFGITSPGIAVSLEMTAVHAYEDGIPVLLNPANHHVAFSLGANELFLDLNTLNLTLSPSLSSTVTAKIADILRPYTQNYSIVLAQDNGYVVQIDNTGNEDQAVFLGRLNGMGADCGDSVSEVVAQRADFSSSAFQTAYGGADILYAGTSYNSFCSGEKIDNKIYALDSQNLNNILWTINEFETLNMDSISGMALDQSLSAPVAQPQYGLAAAQEPVQGDNLYVTTEQRLNSSQQSVWAIDVLTGSVEWSVAAGRIQSRPVVRGDRVYVASINGNLTALDKTDGSVKWTINHFIPFALDFTVGRRAPYNDLIVLVDYFGDVLLVRDDGASATLLWSTDLDTGGGEAAISAPVIDDIHGYIYVGVNNGKVYQLDIGTGAIGPARSVDASSNDIVELKVKAPAADQARPYTLDLIAASEYAEVRRFCTPFMYPPGTLVADGDINTDGFVNAIDVLLATRAVLGLDLLNPTEFGHGDVAPVISNVPNPNGTFDLGDLLMITHKALFGSF